MILFKSCGIDGNKTRSCVNSVSQHNGLFKPVHESGVLIDLSETVLFNSVVTARVAKRAKVMFSQACVTHSVQREGGRGGGQHQRS